MSEKINPNDIQLGDVVTLRSGGPRMTVAELYRDGQTAKCLYFHEGTVPEATIETIALVKASEHSGQ